MWCYAGSPADLVAQGGSGAAFRLSEQGSPAAAQLPDSSQTSAAKQVHVTLDICWLQLVVNPAAMACIAEHKCLPIPVIELLTFCAGVCAAAAARPCGSTGISQYSCSSATSGRRSRI